MTLAQFDFGTIEPLLLKLSLILVKHTYQDFLMKHIYPDIPLAFVTIMNINRIHFLSTI